jgi:predicted nucleic acid-binding protein
MIVHADTSALIDALTGPRRSLAALARLIDEGHRVQVSTMVLYEWLRGPRTRVELSAQEELFPSDAAVPFGAEESALAARLYRGLPRARGREVDLVIASCAMAHEAALWTLNSSDFRDIPGLRVI